MLVITPEVCNLLSYMRNLNVSIDLRGSELADRQTVRFFYKNGNIGAVPVLTKKKKKKNVNKKHRGGGLKIEAGGNENLTINLLWHYGLISTQYQINI